MDDNTYNADYEVKGKKLIITVDLGIAGEESASGKSIVISSTHGAIDVKGAPKPTKLNLNIYQPKKKY